MNNKITRNTGGIKLRFGAYILATATMVAACDGRQENTDDDIVGLEITLSDYRFGVQNIGSTTQKRFELRNVGVDTYPINRVSLSGEHAEDFSVEINENVTLTPGDKVSLDVAFVPVGEGQRESSLDIDYSVVKGAGSNRIEARYYEARRIEDAGDNVSAAQEYRDYLNSGSTTDNKARALIKLSLLEEADIYGLGKDFTLYKSALNLRDEGKIDDSVAALNSLVSTHPDSYLVDDAKYMLGYIQLVDQSNYVDSIEIMQKVINDHPDSSYYDTALYSQGLAEYELGNLQKSEEIFLSLRDRHTGVKLDLFEVNWPKDNYVSRLWFDKADQQLANVEEAQQEG